MPEYEIRVLKDDRYSAAMIHQRILMDDDAAISQGQRLAGSAPFEVWRELDCVSAGLGARVARRRAELSRLLTEPGRRRCPDWFPGCWWRCCRASL